jgi:hypothetical protein
MRFRKSPLYGIWELEAVLKPLLINPNNLNLIARR